MDRIEKGRVPVYCIDSVSDKIESVQHRITARAYEKWISGRANGQLLSPFWDAAETELLHKPAASIHESSKDTTVEITCPDLDPAKIRIFMTPWELLSLAPMKTLGCDRWLFHFMRFPKFVDNVKAQAQYEPNTLRISVPFYDAVGTQGTRLQVA